MDARMTIGAFYAFQDNKPTGFFVHPGRGRLRGCRCRLMQRRGLLHPLLRRTIALLAPAVAASSFLAMLIVRH
jgi:hypothetical protein